MNLTTQMINNESTHQYVTLFKYISRFSEIFRFSEKRVSLLDDLNLDNHLSNLFETCMSEISYVCSTKRCLTFFIFCLVLVLYDIKDFFIKKWRTKCPFRAFIGITAELSKILEIWDTVLFPVSFSSTSPQAHFRTISRCRDY